MELPRNIKASGAPEAGIVASLKAASRQLSQQLGATWPLAA